MKPKYIAVFLAIAVTVGLFGSTSLVAQEKMKYEDYLIELEKWQTREQTAKQEIARLEAEIKNLQQQIADVERQIEETKRTMYRELNTDERGLRNYINQLNSLRDQIRGLMNLAPGELFKRRDEVAATEERFNEMKNRGAAKHPDSRAIIGELERLMNRLAMALKNAGPQFDLYSVVRGDCLFNISGKPEIYNDPFQWLKIWTKNRDLIKNPDLIYPDQNLKIFRDIADNEHLVVKGENLSKIAGYPSVYNDPFQWVKLYEANKAVIKDKNLIYPHMILIKP